MIPPLPTGDEKQRLDALHLYDVLDTPPEPALDDLTALAAQICGAPIALISLVDEQRQWFKSRTGLDVPETSRDISFCGHAIHQHDLFTVTDAARDERFADNPLVTGEPRIRFYAGSPLVTPSGHAIGSLCVLDRVPRQLDPAQEQALRVLGRQVIAQLELRRHTQELGERERLLRAVFDSEPACVQLLGEDGALRLMNRAGLEIFEADSFELLAGRILYPLIAAEQRAAFQGLIERVFLGESASLELQVTGLRGATRWMAMRAAPLRNEHGEVIAALSVGHDVTQRHLAEDALRASEERYRHFVEGLPIAAYTTDATGLITLYNAAAARLWGRHPGPEERWCGSYQLYDAEGQSVPHSACPMARAIQENRLVTGTEMIAERPDGTRFNFMAYVTPFRDRSGRLTGAMNAIVDITERKRAEVHIKQLNRVYAVLSDINQTIVRDRDPQQMLTAACRIAVDKGGFLLAWIGLVSPAGNQLTLTAHAGATPETLHVLEGIVHAAPAESGCLFTTLAWQTGKHAVCNDIATDPDAAPWREAALARGYRAMAALPLGTGGKVIGVFNLYGSEPGFFDGDELRLLDELSLDISFALEINDRENARQRTEAALLASEERFRQIAENIQEVFWITDPQKQSILYVSPAYAAIWGRSCESLYAHPLAWVEAIHPEDRARVLDAAKTRQAHGTYDEQYRIQRPDSTLRWIHDRAVPIRNAAGEVYRIVGVATDITRQRQLEEEFRQSQKMEAIGQLAGGVAHDFNNILSAVMMQTELALLTPALPAETREFLGDIKSATNRAANLTRQLLAFSRRQVMQSRLLDLNDLVTNLTKMLQRILGEDVRLQLNLHSRPLTLRADAGMLDQVLLNLVVNARDAMPSGGRLYIETSERLIDAAEAHLLPDVRPGLYVCLRVTDTGVGIAPDVASRIFEPFFTTKSDGKGTGLGLATVFGIVKQHGGAVQVASELGHGATFSVFLPAAVVSSPPLAEPGKTKPRGGTETILLVEDETSVRMLTRRVLERQGYRVIEARHGLDALNVWKMPHGKIHLLLTDIVMPEGLNGRQLAEQLQLAEPQLRVIFTSGYSPDIAGRELILREGQNFLQKPCPPDQLLAAVRACLDA
jgi:PAS domain S-box-containing protein